ncbi:MAG: hypothetical protein Q9226_007461 [Calogaya cf. arnoldii]
MAQIDLEAATKEQNRNESILPGERGDDADLVATTPMNQLKVSEKKKVAQLCRIARVIVQEMLHSLPNALELQLENSDRPYELLGIATADDDAVSGAKEVSSASGGDHREGDISRTQNDDLMLDQGCDHSSAHATGEETGDILSDLKDDSNKILQNANENPDKIKMGYQRRIEVMTQDRIEDQNMHRREIRGKWRRSEDWEYLEDPWKNIRRGNERLFDESADEQRKALQLELIDAIFSAPRDKPLGQYLDLGLPAIICWVSLVGLRLSAFASTHDSAVLFAQILIECVWACNVSSSAKISDVLESCYRRDLLDNPYCDGTPYPENSRMVRKYIKAVRISIFSLKVLYKHTAPLLDFTEDLNVAWSMPVSQVEERMRVQRYVADSDVERRSFYNVDDFGLEHLQKTGQLEMLWTSYWDEHLELGMKGHAMTLKLYWFCPSLARYFKVVGLCAGLHDDKSLDRLEEIYRTLDMILHSTRDPKKTKKQYQNLEAPEWLSLTAGENSRSPSQDEAVAKPLSQFDVDRGLNRPKYSYEIKEHLTPVTTFPVVERISYLEFPCYYHRLEELRRYMDSRQPRGLRALWRDRRNTNAYYTFWLVTLFGGFGVLLGLLTLAVAIVQAWGQLQALH